MEILSQLIDYFLHIDKYLSVLITNYGSWLYVILFIIIFCETGLVVTPFLPGDSLLFATGALAALNKLDPHFIVILLSIAAILGDTLNYSFGKWVGPKVFHYEKTRFFKKEHLEHTHQFYERHGGKTIIIGRFIPIIRTFAPFVAGIGTMTYWHFLSYNVVGGIIWVAIFIYSGYYFGNTPTIKNNFLLVLVAIIIISVLPGVIEYIRIRYKNTKQPAIKPTEPIKNESVES